MKRILPVCRPDVLGYTYHAFPLSILLVRQESRPWFFSQFIQLMSGTNKDYEYFTDYYTWTYEHTSLVYSPLLITQQTFRDQAADSGEIVAYIAESINRGNYVYVFVDEFYIPGRTLYKDAHVTHDILVHGYDHDQEVLFISGFNKNVVYGQWTVPYDDFVKGYHMADTCSLNNSMIIKMKYNDLAHYRESPVSLYESLTDFLHSRNSSERFRFIRSPLSDKNYVFGLNVYQNLISYLAEVMKGNYTLNVMPFHIVAEHKQVMCNRLRFMEETYNIDLKKHFNCYKSLEDISLKLRTSCIRYSFRPASRLLTKMQELLEKVSVGEKDCMEDIANRLQYLL